MNYFLKKEPPELKRDNRFTLILIIGFIFLLIPIVHSLTGNKSNASMIKSYFLKVDKTSLSIMVQDESIRKNFPSRPWDLTPFFFEKLPINTANKEALMTIKGIGPRLAESILQNRSKFGPFEGIADLKKIKGVGPKRIEYFEKMFDFGGE